MSAVRSIADYGELRVIVCFGQILLKNSCKALVAMPS